MRDIGKNIRDLRVKQEMTQDELAEKLFVTRQTVSNYETGRSRPDVEMLASIAEALNTDPNTLLYGPSPSPSRRPALVRLVAALALLIALTVAYSFLYDYCAYLKTWFFQSIPMMWFGVIGKPLLFLVFGWTAMQALALLRPVTPFAPGTSRKVLAGCFSVLAVYLLITVPFILFASDLHQTLPDFARGWSMVFYTILGVRAGQHSLHGYLVAAFLMGVLFWLCEFPIKHTTAAPAKSE